MNNAKVRKQKNRSKSNKKHKDKSNNKRKNKNKIDRESSNLKLHIDLPTDNQEEEAISPIIYNKTD